MPNPQFVLQKHMKNVLLSVRRLAEEEIAEGNIVKVGTADYHVKVADDTDVPLGVALNTVTTADLGLYNLGMGDIAAVEVEVALIGIVPVVCAAAVTAGAHCTTANNGQIKDEAGDGTDNLCGLTLRTTTAKDEETHMLIVLVPSSD
jgi:hypothetical protein